jgi:hypothetical protein
MLGAALLLVDSARTGWGGFPLIFGVLFLCLATLGVIFPNATAMAMQPFAAEAGSASALLGICQFVLGATRGAPAGLFHDGTTLPMAIQIAAFGLAAREILFLTPKQRGCPRPGAVASRGFETMDLGGDGALRRPRRRASRLTAERTVNSICYWQSALTVAQASSPAG